MAIKINTEVEKKVINDFFNTEDSLAAIAQKNSISPPSVSNILKKHGISSKDRNWIAGKYKFKPNEIEDIVHMYTSGCKQVDIQRKYDIANKTTLRNILKKYTTYEPKECSFPRPQRKFVRGKQLDQLCWYCKNATGGCSWSKNFTPVPGWDAKYIERASAAPTYSIKDCPLFEEG